MIKTNTLNLYKLRPGECNFDSGRWCGYEQVLYHIFTELRDYIELEDPDDDFEWTLNDEYALIVLNEHEKLQYARLQSPFIHPKVIFLFGISSDLCLLLL